MTSDSARAFDIRSFCEVYGVGRTKAYQEIGAGKLRACKIGRKTLIRREDAEAWLQGLIDCMPHRENSERKVVDGR
jgi:excisionase family DNA binding protein